MSNVFEFPGGQRQNPISSDGIMPTDAAAEFTTEPGNDLKSIAPGIRLRGRVAFDLLYGARGVKEELDTAKVPYDLRASNLMYGGKVSYELFLPLGVFEFQPPEEKGAKSLSALHEGLKIHARNLTSGDALRGTSPEVRLAGRHLTFFAGGMGMQDAIVANIEGTGGIVWQNPLTDSDGFPIEEASK